eukprot:TRINITY_DN8416_c0_g1_i2.p1 TRINITY_DN8416_c0_g1~~TRINITY_DN8416_c0_g1_i2.p1  ORF type:complete len:393 (-),score=89.50 TRINITY_DN8416_c0_g1_i2:279-1457(-)
MWLLLQKEFGITYCPEQFFSEIYSFAMTFEKAVLQSRQKSQELKLMRRRSSLMDPFSPTLPTHLASRMSFNPEQEENPSPPPSPPYTPSKTHVSKTVSQYNALVRLNASSKISKANTTTPTQSQILNTNHRGGAINPNIPTTTTSSSITTLPSGLSIATTTYGTTTLGTNTAPITATDANKAATLPFHLDTTLSSNFITSTTVTNGTAIPHGGDTLAAVAVFATAHSLTTDLTTTITPNIICTTTSFITTDATTTDTSTNTFLHTTTFINAITDTATDTTTGTTINKTTGTTTDTTTGTITNTTTGTTMDATAYTITDVVGLTTDVTTDRCTTTDKTNKNITLGIMMTNFKGTHNPVLPATHPTLSTNSTGSTTDAISVVKVNVKRSEEAHV